MHYMMYGRKRELYKIRIPHLSMIKLALHIMKQLLESLDFIIEMCFSTLIYYQSKHLKNAVYSTFLIWYLLIYRERLVTLKYDYQKTYNLSLIY